MTLYEFLSFDDLGQANAVWDGTFLTSRIEGILALNLYDLGGFYVEVFYNTVENRIERLRPFRKTDVLSPYLNQFNIDDLKV
jgi:hypothetical protein